MSFLTRRRSPLRHALWLAGLLVTLAGLFGMHGLDNHGGAGMDTVAHAGMAVPAHGAASGHSALTGNAHGPAGAVVAAEAVLGAVTEASGHAGMDMGATGMCMAVLVLLLIALILRLYASRVRPLLWRLADRPERSPLARGRDPDPPSLLRLSIQRC